ncbi:TPA: hypothetical protein DDW35_03780 [Candidatus Sumerlaeota bacterium]|nr:hypothetical protein [Candidatus Sumerlaeota bacterium]
MRKNSRGLPASQNALVLSALRALSEMDRQVAKQGFQRQPTETLHQFAARIAPDLPAAVDWYMRYAALRYTETLTEEGVEELRRDIKNSKNKKDE